MAEKCPFCGSTKTAEYSKSHSSRVDWRDGLGSPGFIYFTDYYVRCNSCKREWRAKK